MLDSQVDDSSKRTKSSHRPANEEDDQRSYVFVLSSVENKEKPENADRYVINFLLLCNLQNRLTYIHEFALYECFTFLSVDFFSLKIVFSQYRSHDALKGIFLLSSHNLCVHINVVAA